MHNPRPEGDLRQTLAEITRLLERHQVLDTLAQRQETPKRALVEQLQHRQNLVDLQRRLGLLHPADLAYVLQSLPRDERLLIWQELEAQQAAETLVEVDAAAGKTLVDATSRRRLKEILRQLDVDDLASLSDILPEETLRDVMQSLGTGDRSLLRETISYPEESVGELMSRDVAAVRESQTVAEVLADLRLRRELPTPLDRIFVVDARNLLRGAVSLEALVLGQPDQTMAQLMDADPLAFRPDETAAHAARAFERYNLVSAPVINDRGKLVGRLTVDSVMDFIRLAADSDALAMAGLRGGEDLFASVWQSARNRWPWLFVNLITAFIATRFIGLFESTIRDMVALATLMPIVASIAGNTGNQTVALVIRGLVLDPLTSAGARRVLRKELVVSLLNGLMWGGVVGCLAILVYRQLRLGAVMAGAVLLNLVIAATVGVLVPLGLQRWGRDPAQGASVLLTFVTDSMGFFLFLGLAHLFL
jgi:magnesium transporter